MLRMQSQTVAQLGRPGRKYLDMRRENQKAPMIVAPPSLFQAGKTTMIIGNANLEGDFQLGGEPAFTIPYIVGVGYTHTETETDVTILRAGTYDLRIWAQIASMATSDVPSWPPYYSLAIWPRSSNSTLSPAARMAWSSYWYDGYARDTLSAPNVLGAWLGAGAQAMSHQLAYLVNVPSDNAIFSVFHWASLAHVNWTMTVHMWVQLYGPLEYR